jgi:hypothetical protein
LPFTISWIAMRVLRGRNLDLCTGRPNPGWNGDHWPVFAREYVTANSVRQQWVCVPLPGLHQNPIARIYK